MNWKWTLFTQYFIFLNSLSQLILKVFSTAVLPLMLWINPKLFQFYDWRVKVSQREKLHGSVQFVNAVFERLGDKMWFRSEQWCLQKGFLHFLFSLTLKQFYVKTDTYCWLNANRSAAMYIWLGQTIFYRPSFISHPTARDWRSNIIIILGVLSLPEDFGWSHKLVRYF